MTGRRWENYVLARGTEAQEFWEDLLSSRSTALLYITSQGFDPRMCDGVAMVLGAGGSGVRDCLLVQYGDDAELESSERESVQRNREQLDKLFDARGHISEVVVSVRDEQRKFVGADEVASAVRDVDLSQYEHIVVDMSSTPRTMALTILAYMLFASDRALANGTCLNVHVISVESADIDRAIDQLGIDESPTMLPGFVAEIDAERSSEEPRVWFPILGEGKVAHVTKLNEYIRPSEICPVVPSPSRWPRRGDELVQEYRETLFDVFRVDPRNIIYAAETNPFECYRQLHRSISAYREALEIIGGFKAFVSPLSSRLLSVGALLACYELRDTVKVGIAYVEAHNYHINIETAMAAGERLPYTLWVAGEAYV